MYRFSRRATIVTASHVSNAVNWSMEIAGYLAKNHNIQVKAGMELFGGLNVHWQFESDSLDKISTLNQKLMQDKTYLALLEKAKDYWVPGSLKDQIVNFPG